MNGLKNELKKLKSKSGQDFDLEEELKVITPLTDESIDLLVKNLNVEGDEEIFVRKMVDLHLRSRYECTSELECIIILQILEEKGVKRDVCDSVRRILNIKEGDPLPVVMIEELLGEVLLDQNDPVKVGYIWGIVGYIGKIMNIDFSGINDEDSGDESDEDEDDEEEEEKKPSETKDAIREVLATNGGDNGKIVDMISSFIK